MYVLLKQDSRARQNTYGDEYCEIKRISVRERSAVLSDRGQNEMNEKKNCFLDLNFHSTFYIIYTLYRAHLYALL